VERVTRGELESKEGEIEKKSREEERFWRKISFSWSHDCLVLFISFFLVSSLVLMTFILHVMF